MLESRIFNIFFSGLLSADRCPSEKKAEFTKSLSEKPMIPTSVLSLILALLKSTTFVAKSLPFFLKKKNLVPPYETIAKALKDLFLRVFYYVVWSCVKSCQILSSYVNLCWVT